MDVPPCLVAHGTRVGNAGFVPCDSESQIASSRQGQARFRSPCSRRRRSDEASHIPLAVWCSFRCDGLGRSLITRGTEEGGSSSLAGSQGQGQGLGAVPPGLEQRCGQYGWLG